MKKSFLLIMCLLLAIAVVACNANDNKTDDTTAADTTTAVETQTEGGSSENTTAGNEDTTVAGNEDATTVGESTTVGGESTTSVELPTGSEVTTSGSENTTSATEVPTESTTNGGETTTTSGSEDTTSVEVPTGSEVTTSGSEETTAAPEETTVAGGESTTAAPEETTTFVIELPTEPEVTTELMTEHEHTFSDDWSANNDGHWHAATCEHVGEISDMAAHVDEDEDDCCDVCDFDITCEHELSDEIDYVAGGHYHIPDCNHDDLILDLEAHADADNDGKCDVCEFEFDDFIDEITSTDAANRVNGGTISYVGQYEKKDITYNLGFGFLFMDENIEYSYDAGVIVNNKHSVHAFNNGNVFYVVDNNGMVSREDYMITTDNVKGYKFSSDMFFYLSLDDTDPCGVEDFLYAFYNFAKTNYANTLSITWGETNNISFMAADEYSAKVFAIDFTVSENGVITTLNLTSKQYTGYISAEQLANGGIILDWEGNPDVDENGNPTVPDYTMDENGVVTFLEGATVDAEVKVSVTQTEGSRENIKTSYNLEEILVNSYDLMNGEEVVGTTLNATVGTNLTLPFANMNPTTANLELDKITATIVDETGSETWNVNVYAFADYLNITPYKAGNYLVTLTSLNTVKAFKLVVAMPETTEIHAAVDNYGLKEAFTEKTIPVNSTFNFVGLAQDTYADATFTATLPEGTTGAALVVLDTADGYAFTATEVGTYVVTLVSNANPEVTNTVTFNVIAAANVSDIFKGTWENTTYGIKVEINPTDATSGTYTMTMNNEPVQFAYTLSGTAIDAIPVAGGAGNWTLQFNSDLQLEVVSPYGMSFPLEQTSTGEDAPAGNTFGGTYSGIVNVMGGDMDAKVVVSGDSFTFEIDGTLTTYYYSINAETGYLTTIIGNGNPPAEFIFRYISDMNMLVVEMVHPMTGMGMEIGTLAQATSTDVEPANKMDGKYKGTLDMGTILDITIEVDSLFETMTTVIDGISTTYAYSIGDDGILTTICVGGEQIGDFQFQYRADADVIVVNMNNPRLGYYVYVGDAYKVTEEEEGSSLSVEGIWTSADGMYTFTFWEADGDGTVDFADENGDWLKTRGFYFTMDDAGNITFTSIKGNLSGYMDWSTSSTAKLTEQGIELTLDTGVVVLLAPKAW